MKLRICAVLLMLALSVTLQWVSRLVSPEISPHHGQGHALVTFDDSNSPREFIEASFHESVAVDGGALLLPTQLASAPCLHVLLVLSFQLPLPLAMRLVRTSYTSSAM